ncbi:MAG: hypothetical protein ABIQ64_01960 [Candidatus Saccharimonadales bacterium]
MMNKPDIFQDTPTHLSAYEVLVAKASSHVIAGEYGAAARAFERAGGLAKTDPEIEIAFTLAAAAFVLVGNKTHAMDDLDIAESFDSSQHVS